MNVLNSPTVYQLFQQAGGFFGARVKAIDEFLAIKPGMRVIDIGCGPGYILAHLPSGIDYVGFDIDEAYIAHANKTFGDRGRFHHRIFDLSAAQEFAPADIVMMNGVLHHIDDENLARILVDIHHVLADDGVLFTLDGCYKRGQSSFAKWMLDNDRGKFVRDAAGYSSILKSVFSNVDIEIRENYAFVPYTFAIGLSRKA